MSGVQVIDVPGQGEVEFPADMPDEEIRRVIKRNLLAPNKFSETPGGAALSTRGSVGFGKHGDTMGDIRKAREQAAYGVGMKVEDLTGSPYLGSLSSTVADIATDPLTLAGAGIGTLARPVFRAGGERLMQAALKPNKAARDTGDAVKAVKTLLEEGANVSQGGVEKLTSKIDTLDDELGKVIASSKAKLQNTDLLQSLQGLIARYGQGTRQAKNIEQINAEADNLLKHPAFNDAGEISVQDAQAMKRQNYKELKAEYAKKGAADAGDEALMSINRDIAGGISKAEPASASLNAQMSPLINARDLAQERTLAAGNTNLGGISWLAPNIFRTALALADRSPLVGSLLARGLYSGVAPSAPYAGAGMGALIGQQLER